MGEFSEHNSRNKTSNYSGSITLPHLTIEAGNELRSKAHLLRAEKPGSRWPPPSTPPPPPPHPPPPPPPPTPPPPHPPKPKNKKKIRGALKSLGASGEEGTERNKSGGSLLTQM